MEYKRLTTISEITDNPTLKALCESCGESSCDEICCRYQDNDCMGCPLQEAFCRLAAYEDSGLSPEEVQKLAEAKADGRLVELPPDGQIYHIERVKKTGEAWVGNKPCRYITADGYYCGWGLAVICFPFSELGKTAFLTREEAEKALGEG